MEKNIKYGYKLIYDVLISDSHHRKYQLLTNKEQIKIKKSLGLMIAIN